MKSAKNKLVTTSLRSEQRGVVLITAMLLLLVLTVMGLSMFRSFGMQEKIAGNVREKQRALNAAESAQQYAEWWLTNAAIPATGTCNGPPTAIPQICSPPPAPATVDFTALPWVAGVNYMDFNVVNTISANAPSSGSYYATPVFYITDVGPYGVGGELYQIDAVGYGGTPTAVSVVESTYEITQNGAQSPNI